MDLWDIKLLLVGAIPLAVTPAIALGAIFLLRRAQRICAPSLYAAFLLWLLAQQVIRHAELTAGEQVLFITVMLKGAWFAHQPVDDMTVIDVVAVLAA